MSSGVWPNAGVMNRIDTTSSGRGLDVTPVDMGENALIRIDDSSYGGQKWRDDKELRFQFFGDSSFSESSEVNYATTPIIGRSENYYTWISSGNRVISLSLAFVAQGNTSSDVAASCTEEVKRKVDWLMALKQPVTEGNSTRIFPPPAVLLFLGRMFNTGGTAIRAIVTAAQPSYGDTFDPTTFLPYMATVSMTFTAVAKDNQSLPNAALVRSGYGS